MSSRLPPIYEAALLAVYRGERDSVARALQAVFGCPLHEWRKVVKEVAETGKPAMIFASSNSGHVLRMVDLFRSHALLSTMAFRQQDPPPRQSKKRA